MTDVVLGEQEAVRQLCNRLRRIEGQARGLVGMIEEGRDCGEIAVQMAALKAAVNKAAMAFVASYFERCLDEVGGDDARKAVQQVAQVFLRLA